MNWETNDSKFSREVRQAYNDYTAAAKQLETTERSLIAATKAFETEQERVRVGASTLIELTQAQAEFRQCLFKPRSGGLPLCISGKNYWKYYLGRISTEL